MLTAARNFAVRALKSAFERAGLQLAYDLPVRNAEKLFSLKALECGIATVLDVGANRGQFALALRSGGYTGRVVSFEPLSRAHSALLEASARDSAWTIAPRMALGSTSGNATINISKNLASSSLLGIASRTTDAAPEAVFVASEEVAVNRLDDARDREWKNPFAIKLDTQGFELNVLDGAPDTLKQTRLIMVEMSLVPLYEGGATFLETYQFLEQNGFRCITLVQSFEDRAKNELLQVDAVFIR